MQRFDAKTMVDNPKVSASTGMVDDGTGVKEVLATTIPPFHLNICWTKIYLLDSKLTKLGRCDS